MDWRDPEMYFITFCIQYVCGFTTAYIGACNVSYISASIFILIFLAKDIKGMLLHELNESGQAGTDRVHLMNQFKDILEFHTDARQLSTNHTNHNFGFIFSIFNFELYLFKAC